MTAQGGSGFWENNSCIDPQLLLKDFQSPANSDEDLVGQVRSRLDPQRFDEQQEYDLTSRLLEDVHGTSVMGAQCSYPAEYTILPNHDSFSSPATDTSTAAILAAQHSTCESRTEPRITQSDTARPSLRVSTSTSTRPPKLSTTSSCGEYDRNPTTPEIRIHDFSAPPSPLDLRLKQASEESHRRHSYGTLGQSSPPIATASYDRLSPTTPQRFVMDTHNVGDMQRQFETAHLASNLTSSLTRGRARSRSGSRGSDQTRSRSGSSAGSSAGSSVTSSFTFAFSCDHLDCEKRYKNIAALNHHKRCHQPYHQRPHVCTKCSARFSYKKDLNRHWKKVDHSKRSYACPECSQPFGRADHLERHLELHTKTRAVSEVGASSSTPDNSSLGAVSMPSSSVQLPQLWSDKRVGYPGTPFTEYTTHSDDFFPSPFLSRARSGSVNQSVDAYDPDDDPLLRYPASPTPLGRSRSNKY